MLVNPLLALLNIAGGTGAVQGVDGLLQTDALVTLTTEQTGLFSSLLQGQGGAQLAQAQLPQLLTSTPSIAANAPTSPQPNFTPPGQNLLITAESVALLNEAGADTSQNKPVAPIVKQEDTVSSATTDELLAALSAYNGSQQQVQPVTLKNNDDQTTIVNIIPKTPISTPTPTTLPEITSDQAAQLAAQNDTSGDTTLNDEALKGLLKAQQAITNAATQQNNENTGISTALERLQKLQAATNALNTTPQPTQVAPTSIPQVPVQQLVAAPSQQQPTNTDNTVQQQAIVKTETPVVLAYANIVKPIALDTTPEIKAETTPSTTQQQLAQRVIQNTEQKDKDALPSISSAVNNADTQPKQNNHAIATQHTQTAAEFHADAAQDDSLSIDSTDNQNLPLTAKSDALVTHAKNTESAETAPRTPAEQVALQVQKMIKQGSSQFKMTLEPEHLGKVEVRIEFNNTRNTTSVIVIADKADTFDMLQKDSRNLERALQDAGLKTQDNSLQFSLRDGGGQQFSAYQQAQQDREYLQYNALNSNDNSALSDNGTQPARQYVSNNLLDIQV